MSQMAIFADQASVAVDNGWSEIASLSIDVGAAPQWLLINCQFNANANAGGIVFAYRFRRGSETIYPPSGSLTFAGNPGQPTTIFHAEIDPAAIGSGVQGFSVEFKRQSGSAPVNFSMRKMTAIVEKA